MTRRDGLAVAAAALLGVACPLGLLRWLSADPSSRSDAAVEATRRLASMKGAVPPGTVVAWAHGCDAGAAERSREAVTRCAARHEAAQLALFPAVVVRACPCAPDDGAASIPQRAAAVLVDDDGEGCGSRAPQGFAADPEAGCPAPLRRDGASSRGVTP